MGSSNRWMLTVPGIALGLSVALNQPATAENGFYAQGSVGMSAISTATVSIVGTPQSERPGFKPFFALGAAGGYRWGHFRAEVNMSYRSADIENPSSDPTEDSLYGTLRVLTPMVNAYYDIPTNWAVRPYLGIGVGIAWIYADTTNLVSADLRIDDSQTQWAANALAGFGWQISEDTVIDLGYRYLRSGDPTFDGTLAGATVGVDTEVASHEALVSVRYQF
ncbi:outer membrane beta-barrel protein [Myxococcota bacterium]|nr:outer membrane beta-barrel protein [Myxococcota bacterium]